MSFKYAFIHDTDHLQIENAIFSAAQNSESQQATKLKEFQAKVRQYFNYLKDIRLYPECVKQLKTREQDVFGPEDFNHLDSLYQDTVQKSKIEFTELIDMLLTPKSWMSDYFSD